MEIVGDYVCDALVGSFLTSLKAVATLFGINRKNKMRMVLKIYLTLKNKEVIFDHIYYCVICTYLS